MNIYEEEEILAEPDKPTFWTSAFHLFKANAWYIVALVAVLCYIWREKLSSKYEQWILARNLAKNCSELNEDPNLHMQREQERLIAVEKLQEEYNKQACKAKELEKEKQEKIREEFIAKHKSQGGRKLNEDYLPLAGGSSLGYRAPRRTACPGGSCNNK